MWDVRGRKNKIERRVQAKLVQIKLWTIVNLKKK